MLNKYYGRPAVLLYLIFIDIIVLYSVSLYCKANYKTKDINNKKLNFNNIFNRFLIFNSIFKNLE